MQLIVSRSLQPVVPSRDVFDSLDVWRTSPDVAFASWLSRQRLKASSKTVYIAMFRKFVFWLHAHRIALTDVGAEHLRDFLDSERLEKHQRYRYVRLVERAFDHMAALGFRGANPGRRAARERIGAGKDDPPRFLTPGEREGLLDVIARRVRCEDAYGSDEDEVWTVMRDAALAAVMLGAGLTVCQARALSINCIDLSEGWIALPPAGRARAHRTRLLSFAQQALAAWLPVRRALEPASELAFPAQRRACGFQPRRATPHMHAASLFRRAQALMKEAGIEGERACAQTLRNTFAAQLFEAGAADDLVTEYLGFFKLMSTQRLRAAYHHWRAALLRVDPS